MTLTAEAIRKIVERISYPGMAFLVRKDVHGLVLQLYAKSGHTAPDESLGLRGRKFRLSAYMTPSQIVRTAFLAVTELADLEAREAFRYREAAIFSPHLDVERLAELALDPAADDTGLA